MVAFRSQLRCLLFSAVISFTVIVFTLTSRRTGEHPLWINTVPTESEISLKFHPLEISTVPTKNEIFLKLIHHSISIVMYQCDCICINETLAEVFKTLPAIDVLIIGELECPLLQIRGKELIDIHNVRVVNLRFNLSNTYENKNLLYFIKTRYVLFLLETVIFDVQSVHDMLLKLEENRHSILSAPIEGHNFPVCLKIQMNVKEWTLRYENNIDTKMCDMVQGFQVIMAEVIMLRQLSEGFLQPFPESLYLQAIPHGYKAHLMKNTFFRTRQTIKFDKRLYNEQKRRMYKSFGFKKVVTEENNVEWYGCSKATRKCSVDEKFGGRWTPPCCLEAMKQTVTHVAEVLERCNVRYWLTFGSLIGAMRDGGIIPWDHDADVGIYKEDVDKCEWLAKTKEDGSSVEDDEGFLWLRDSTIWRVRFSKVNHNYVDIYEYSPEDGMMKGPYEFPESYLKPMTTVEFVGRKFKTMNNIREYLENSYGKGVIENPEKE